VHVNRVLATRRYRWVVFDADGTLFDFEHAEEVALARTFTDFGLTLSSEMLRTYQAISAVLWRKLEAGEMSWQRLRTARFEELLSREGIDLDPAGISDRYVQNLGREGRLLPDAEAVVRELAPRFGLLLATNGIAEVQRRRLGGSVIRPFFTDLVISEEIGVSKPAREFFAEAFKRMGHPERDEVLVVGDGLSSDIAGGAGFGTDTCWFNPRRAVNDSPVTPTYEISALPELLDILGPTRTE
jgi:2-haloacid dehalogenase